MKSKIILAATLVFASTLSSFASDRIKQIPGEVLTAFHSDFSATGKVTWEAATGYYKAGFIEAGVICYAFYTTNGELMGMGRQLTTDMIPLVMAKQLQANYPGYTLTELYEVGTEKTGDYLMMLSKGKEQLRIRSADGSALTTVKN